MPHGGGMEFDQKQIEAVNDLLKNVSSTGSGGGGQGMTVKI